MAKPIPASNRVVGAGDNLITTDRLAESFAPFEQTLSAYEQEAANIPTSINTDKESGTLQDLYKEIDAHAKAIEGARIDVKEPYLNAGRTIDGFFKGLTTRAEASKNKIGSVIQSYLRRKADARRREEEEAARKLREEEAEKRRLAEEARLRAEELAAANKPKRADAQQAKAAEAEDAANNAGMEAFERESNAQAKSADFARTRSAAGSLGTLADTWNFRIDDIDAVKGAKLWPLVARIEKERAIRQYIKLHAPKQLAEGEEWQPLDGVTMFRASKLQVR